MSSSHNDASRGGEGKLAGRLNLIANVVGVAVLVAAFAVSAIHVASNADLGASGDDGLSSADAASGTRRVTIMHWQLEPGYREAMQRVIDDYNALPRVREANVVVEQLGVTERVYAQVLNVHLISGTAPDLCQLGMARMTQGTGVASFFVPLGAVASLPNPYNDGNLAEIAWQETFLDGMQSSFDRNLQNYFSAPTTMSGSVRLFYNASMVAEAKQVLRDAAAAQPRPEWFADLLLRPDPAGETTDGLLGYVPEDKSFQTWLAGDAEPDTLGRFFAICEAVKRLPVAQARTVDLAPVAGSSYAFDTFVDTYLVPFTANLAGGYDVNLDSYVDGREAWASWADGAWTFEQPQVRSYYECLAAFVEYFPRGFLGLDREQARRRFVNEQAAFVPSGPWDAAGIFAATEGRVLEANEEPDPGENVTLVDGDRRAGFKFDTRVMEYPLPGPGERWSSFSAYGANQADVAAGGKFGVYQQSPNKVWAVDFLQYLTSRDVNERFNQEAGWIPVVVGTEPSQEMQAFAPDLNGVSRYIALYLDEQIRDLRTRYQGALKSHLGGETSYETFVDSVSRDALNPQIGFVDTWAFFTRGDTWPNGDVKGAQQVSDVQAAMWLIGGRDSAKEVLGRSVQREALLFNGNGDRAVWRAFFPDGPYPYEPGFDLDAVRANDASTYQHPETQELRP